MAVHPEDEVLGCRGTRAKYKKEGNKIYCLFLGRGKSSRFEAKNIKTEKKEQNILDREAQKAAKVLGISKIFFKNFPDQKYDVVPFLDIVKSIEEIKKRNKTRNCFYPPPGRFKSRPPNNF